MNINSILDSIKYSIASSNNGKIEIKDNSFLLNLLKEDYAAAQDKTKTFTVSKPWKENKDFRFPVTSFILGMLLYIVELIITSMYVSARILRFLLLGKKHDKDLSLSPRFNFVLFAGAITIYVVAIIYIFIFFIKSVLLFNPDSSVNEQGAISIPQPCSVENYVYLFNAAECWANTGIKVLEGDEIKIAASGSFYSKISQMNKCANKNEVLPYSRVNISSELEPSDVTTRKILMYKGDDAIFGSLLLQIKEDCDEPLYDGNKNSKIIQQLKYDKNNGFKIITAKSTGVLNFAVNDIYFTKEVLDSIRQQEDSTIEKLEFKTIKLTKERIPIQIKELKESLGEGYKGIQRDMWFYDNVGEILLSITVTRNNISENELMPTCFVKQYRWIEAKVLPLSKWGIIWLGLVGVLIVFIWFSIDYLVGLRIVKAITRLIVESKKRIKVYIKRVFVVSSIFFLFPFVMSAQTEKVPAYFTTKQMPDMLKFLPIPPDFSSRFFINDSIKYEWGKEIRKNLEHADIAKRDAVYGLETIIKEFSIPFGLQISKKGTPQIYKMLEESLATCDSICTLPKAHYQRIRPYTYYNEHTLIKEQEDSHRYNGSYPSGHTILGWSAALLLMEINPEAQDTLLSRGYMFGESRIVAGYHWQSDVDAGRLAASAAYAKLHTSKRFLKQMKRARREFQKIRRKESINSVIEY